MIFLNPNDLVELSPPSREALHALDNPLEFTIAATTVWNNLPNLRAYFCFKHKFMAAILFVARLGKNGYIVFTRDDKNSRKCHVDVYAPRYFLRPQKFAALCQMAVALGRSHVEAYTANATLQRFLERAGFSRLRTIKATGQVCYAANITYTEIETCH